jgi:hypothetical protein
MIIRIFTIISLTLIFFSNMNAQINFDSPNSVQISRNIYNGTDIIDSKLYETDQKGKSLFISDINNTIFFDNFLNQKIHPFHNFDSLSSSNDINTSRLVIVSGGLVGLFVGFHFYQMNAWWKNERGPFHVQDDPDYALKIDKAGHFYGGMMSAKLGTGLADWVGYDQRTSAWIGAAIGSLWELYIEFEDGFGKNWGFSPSDATADVLGAFYPVAQEYWEPLRSFNVKFSYLPSKQLNETSSTGNKKIIFDDYEGHTYWLRVDILNLLPEETKKEIPDYLKWLQIAFGYGLRNYNGEEESVGHNVTDRELYIALDYNFEKLLNIDTEFFRSLKSSSVARSAAKIFDFFHFPSPAVRFTFPGKLSKSPTHPIIYGFYFSM